MKRDKNQFVDTAGKFEPAYLGLHRSGELKLRAATAVSRLASCRLCPRACGVNRLANETGFCQIGRRAFVSSCFPHHGEEDCLRGRRGSGTIFFSRCNIGCVFCQNADISRSRAGAEAGPEELAALMLKLQELGCHNINLVTPSHVIAQIIEALPVAVEQGLRLPLVYNTGGYDCLETLELLAGIIDIYMPDFKFWDPALAKRYLNAEDYPEVARQALKEMQRQTGDLTFDDQGLAQSGVLVRHLVMPGGREDTRQIMRFLATEVSPHIFVNVMAQYHPAGDVNSSAFPELNRRLTPDEYLEAVHIATDEGVHRHPHS